MALYKSSLFLVVAHNAEREPKRENTVDDEEDPSVGDVKVVLLPPISNPVETWHQRISTAKTGRGAMLLVCILMMFVMMVRV